MKPQPIELRKLRDFGQVINDTFAFLKENVKPMLNALLIICGFFILMEIISSIFTYAGISSLFTAPVGEPNPVTGVPMYTIGILFDAIFSLLAQMFVNLVAVCYISVYVQKNNITPTIADVWSYFKYYFWRVLGAGILVAIMFFIGCLFCLIGEIVLLPYLALIVPIIVIENSSFSYAFNKCFRLIKNNWWFTFGVIIIMWIIVWVASLITATPLTLISSGELFLPLKAFTLPLVIVICIIKGVLMLLYILPVIAICLCYFDLSEQKEGTGLLNRIGKIGMTDEKSDPTLPSEEY